MKRQVSNKSLGVLAYAGTLIYVATISLAIIWSKNQSPVTTLNYTPETVVIILFILGCSVASGMFGYALLCNGKKSIFIPALIISTITGIAGILVLLFVGTLISWGT